jgi:hypothetical protein
VSSAAPVRSDLHIGGANLSPSYLTKWWQCPRLWFYKYVIPRPGGRGTATVGHTGKDLILGSAVHLGLEYWYRSGLTDGNYNLPEAIEAALREISTRREEFWETKDAEWAVGKAEYLLEKYHEKWGPGGSDPEFPTIKVMTGPDGRPLIEQTFAIPVGSYQLTVRPDLVATVAGFAGILEHKTVSAQRVRAQVDTMKLGGQTLAEYAVLQGSGVDVGAVYANFLVKDRGKSDKPVCLREPIKYTDQQVHQYLRDVHRTIGRIEEAMAIWTRLVDQGVDYIVAAEEAFPLGGVMSQNCVKFGRCSHYDVCSSPGREYQSLDAFQTAMKEPPK